MLNISFLKNLNPKDLQNLIKRSTQTAINIEQKVQEIIHKTKTQGDKALHYYTQKFDQTSIQDLRVSNKEIKEAYQKVSPEFIKAFKQAQKHSEKFEKHLYNQEKQLTVAPGITVWRQWRPIEKVGLYIPGGKANYPSSLLMTAIPAKIAGCSRFIVCTPPNRQGKIPPTTLVACHLTEVQEIYKVGGAQAIAAMAYGTQTIPKVYKIFGAGNSFVTTAKMQVFGEVDIDLPAGPSEIMILADQTAPPSFVAADLLSQAEHAPDSACLLITDCQKLATDVQIELKKQIKNLSTQKTIEKSFSNYGHIILVDKLEQSLNFINDYAPEHLEIITTDNQKYLPHINNVGSVFLGPYAPEPAGDYASGSNHVLPTNGYAKIFNPLSVEAFCKKIQIQELTQKGLKSIQKTIGVLAQAEGLPAHKNAVDIRFSKPSKPDK